MCAKGCRQRDRFSRGMMMEESELQKEKKSRWKLEMFFGGRRNVQEDDSE